MIRDNHLLTLRWRAIAKACVDANPDLVERIGRDADVAVQAALIGRADVVLAFTLDPSARRFIANVSEIDHWWNLQRDQLSAQSDECIGFIDDRLGRFRR